MVQRPWCKCHTTSGGRWKRNLGADAYVPASEGGLFPKDGLFANLEANASAPSGGGLFPGLGPTAPTYSEGGLFENRRLNTHLATSGGLFASQGTAAHTTANRDGLSTTLDGNDAANESGRETVEKPPATSASLVGMRPSEAGEPRRKASSVSMDLTRRVWIESLHV